MSFGPLSLENLLSQELSLELNLFVIEWYCLTNIFDPNINVELLRLGHN